MYCSLCKRIIDIRKNQGKNYFNDLCEDCKMEYLKRDKKYIKTGKKLLIKAGSL